MTSAFTLTRRRLILTAGASLAVAAFGGMAFAQAQETMPKAQGQGRTNPMPAELRDALERDPRGPVLGNPNGNVTLTEFFDYNCGHCRAMLPRLRQVMDDDPDLRVALRELPVFGEGSYFAARASLASMNQNRYWDFHRALLTMKGRAEGASVMATAARIGLDSNRLRRDMEESWIVDHLATSLELADHMGLLGTPTYIAGDEAVFGRQEVKDLKEMIARARLTIGKAPQARG